VAQLKVWRIETFTVTPWPKEKYGQVRLFVHLACNTFLVHLASQQLTFGILFTPQRSHMRMFCEYRKRFFLVVLRDVTKMYQNEYNNLLTFNDVSIDFSCFLTLNSTLLAIISSTYLNFPYMPSLLSFSLSSFIEAIPTLYTIRTDQTLASPNSIMTFTFG